MIETKTVCRHCFQKTFHSRRSFFLPGSEPQYAPDRTIQLEETHLEVSVSPEKKKLLGKVTHHFKALVREQKMVLDQIGIHILSVTSKAKKLQYSVGDDKLSIYFEKEIQPGEKFTLEISYEVTDPKRGLYFITPSEDYPQKPYQVWSQGQDEDNRYWIPMFDYPNQKIKTQMKVRVPKGYLAISNGQLVKKDESSASETEFHYSLAVPHVSYLMTLVIGKFTYWKDDTYKRIPIEYYVEDHRVEDGKRAFDRTPDMLRAFEKVLEVPYPYEKYSQVAVRDFIFGGMENTSATTQTDLTLHDEVAHQEFSSDSLVSHELAHQWFGNLVTCRDWSHGWLNEGFATFMERVWIENNSEWDGGEEEAKYFSYQDFKDYLDEDELSYIRPIVCKQFIEPIDIFDRHLYQKGGLVLNLLRAQLGTDLFWKSIQHYLKKHQKSHVETIDLIRAIEEVTGRNMRRFFDEWIFSAGIPQFELSYQWHEDKKQVEISLEQKQTNGQPFLVKDDVQIPLFHLTGTFQWLEGSDEKYELHQTQIELGNARERIFLPIASEPIYFRFDPNHTIPKKMKFPRPKKLLINQLKKDPDCMGRIEAAKELSKMVDPTSQDILTALKESLLSDSFWGVQAEVALVLGEIKTDEAFKILAEGLNQTFTEKNRKAKKYIAQALGQFPTQRSYQLLTEVISKDKSYFVQSKAITSTISVVNRALRLSKPVVDLKEYESFLMKQLEKESFRDVVRGAALNAISQIQGVCEGDKRNLLSLLFDYSKPLKGKNSVDVRMHAIRSLSYVLKYAQNPIRSQIVAHFDEMILDSSFFIKYALVSALESSGLTDVIPVLDKLRARALDGRIKREAWVAIDYLSTAAPHSEPVTQLKTQQDKMDEEMKKLKSMIEELKSASLNVQRAQAPQ